MIRVQRITLGIDLSFEHVQILEANEKDQYPNFFENANFVFKRTMAYIVLHIIMLRWLNLIN
jgi:hypothetical protein